MGEEKLRYPENEFKSWSNEFRAGFDEGIRRTEIAFQTHIDEWQSKGDCENQCSTGVILKSLVDKILNEAEDMKKSLADFVLSAHSERIKELKAALKTSMTALDDWLNSYASD